MVIYINSISVNCFGNNFSEPILIVNLHKLHITLSLKSYFIRKRCASTHPDSVEANFHRYVEDSKLFLSVNIY